MANDLTAVIPQILAQGLMALRSNNVMPALVNSDYDTEAAQQGATIDVPIPSAIAAQAVTPANTPPATADVNPTSVPIELSQWYEAPFYLTDKDLKEAMNGTIPMQASEAVKALADNVNAYIFSFYTGVYGSVGVAGTTPFGTDTTEATEARKVLNQQLAPMNPRRFVIDPDAEAKALNLRAFQDFSFSGSAEGIREGEINRKLGFDWLMDQQVPTHTSGGAASATTDATGYAVGLKTVALASAGTGAFLVGDIITFAGDTQTYVITSGDADVSDGGSISFEPGLQVAIPASATAITATATHVVNLAFHRDAFAFASRPLEDVVDPRLGSIIVSQADPVSGLSLRLEVKREHKRTRWSFDILYGAQLIRRELATRVLG